MNEEEMWKFKKKIEREHHPHPGIKVIGIGYWISEYKEEKNMRCKYSTKNEVKGPDGMVWSTYYDCCKEGHPVYYGIMPHPACAECNLCEVIEDE